MLLYNSQVSGNCYKVRLLFAHLGIEYEIQELDVVDRSNRPEVLGGLNPALRVPTLVLDDGRALGESDAILFYFADGTEYLPDGPLRAGAGAAVACSSSSTATSRTSRSRGSARCSGSRCPTSERRGHVSAGGEAALQAMEGHLNDHPFLVGDRYTIADIALYAYTHVAPEGGFELEPYPAIGAWLRRVATQPGHVPITA